MKDYCVWREVSSYNNWLGDCGVSTTSRKEEREGFINNHVTYCCNCGKKLRVLPFKGDCTADTLEIGVDHPRNKEKNTSKRYPKLRIKQTGEYPILNDTEIFLGDENLDYSLRSLKLHMGLNEVTIATIELIVDVDTDINSNTILERNIKE